MKSIRRQLTSRLLASLFLLVTLCGAILFHTMKKTLVSEYDSALEAKARALASLVMQEAGGKIEFEFADELMPVFGDSPRPDYFEIWLEDGRVIARSHSLGSDNLPRLPGTFPKPRIVGQRLPDGRDGRAVTIQFLPHPDPDPDEGAGTGETAVQGHPQAQLIIAQGRESLDRTLHHLLLRIIGAGLALPLGIALIVWLVVKKGLRPLDRLATEAAAVDPHHLQHRFTESAMPNELLPICRRLNDLLERIEGAFVRERRFSDDIAHELRTPIAELRSLSEVALLCPQNEALGRKALHEARAISLQMEQLVGTLLMLARCEAGIQKVILEGADLGEMIEQAWAPCREQAGERGLTCGWEVAGGLTVQTDKTMLQSVLGNLFSNAVAHAPEGGRIRIQATGTAQAICLVVENTNSSLNAEDLPRLFEPFWQKDSSRTDSAHSGLGLSLVEAMCRPLNIEVRASLPERDLFQIILSFRTYSGETPMGGD